VATKLDAAGRGTSRADALRRHAVEFSLAFFAISKADSGAGIDELKHAMAGRFLAGAAFSQPVEGGVPARPRRGETGPSSVANLAAVEHDGACPRPASEYRPPTPAFPAFLSSTLAAVAQIRSTVSSTWEVMKTVRLRCADPAQPPLLHRYDPAGST
jgi:hypothetical protein